MPNEPQLSLEQPRSLFGTWLGVVLLFAAFALVVWVVFNIMPRTDNYEAKRAQARVEKLKTASEEWNTSLHTYGWVDKEKGIARIPVQRAMELTVKELAQKKPAPAGPIATPAAPAAAPATAPVTPESSPAPAASDVTTGQPATAASPTDAAPATKPAASVAPAAQGSASPNEPAAKPLQSPPAASATPPK